MHGQPGAEHAAFWNMTLVCIFSGARGTLESVQPLSIATPGGQSSTTEVRTKSPEMPSPWHS